jgi:hypothetical protein
MVTLQQSLLVRCRVQLRCAWCELSFRASGRVEPPIRRASMPRWTPSQGWVRTVLTRYDNSKGPAALRWVLTTSLWSFHSLSYDLDHHRELFSECDWIRIAHLRARVSSLIRSRMNPGRHGLHRINISALWTYSIILTRTTRSLVRDDCAMASCLLSALERTLSAVALDCGPSAPESQTPGSSRCLAGIWSNLPPDQSHQTGCHGAEHIAPCSRPRPSESTQPLLQPRNVETEHLESVVRSRPVQLRPCTMSCITAT